MSHDDSALVVERALQLHDEVVAKLFPSTEPVYICTTRFCVLIQVVEWSIERERKRDRIGPPHGQTMSHRIVTP